MSRARTSDLNALTDAYVHGPDGADTVGLTEHLRGRLIAAQRLAFLAGWDAHTRRTRNREGRWRGGRRDQQVEAWLVAQDPSLNALRLSPHLRARVRAGARAAFLAGWEAGPGPGTTPPKSAPIAATPQQAARAARRYVARLRPEPGLTGCLPLARAAFLDGWAKGRGEAGWTDLPVKAWWVHVTSEDARHGRPAVGLTTADGRQIDLVFRSWASVTELANTLIGVARGAQFRGSPAADRAVSPTGRFDVTAPAEQNVPRRSAEGRAARRAVTPPIPQPRRPTSEELDAIVDDAVAGMVNADSARRREGR